MLREFAIVLLVISTAAGPASAGFGMGMAGGTNYGSSTIGRSPEPAYPAYQIKPHKHAPKHRHKHHVRVHGEGQH